MERSVIDTRGFTLIELMVVIVIIGILAGLLAPRIMSKPDEAKWGASKVDIKSIENALKMYKLHNGAYPSTEQGLQSLVEPPQAGTAAKNWQKGGYLDKFPLDQWDNEFIYLSPGVHGDFDIISYGADGIPEGDGWDRDINSWELR